VKSWIKEVIPRFFVFGFGVNYPNGGIGKEVHEFIKLGISGVDIFPRNVSDPVQVWVTLKHLVEFANRKLVITTDQEGGGFSSLKNGFTPGVPPMALTATNNPVYSRRQGEIISRELSTVGVNTVFAPTLDVNTSLDNPIIGIRSFSRKPDDVLKYSTEFIKGLKSSNTAICVKHFPGHGPTNKDSHENLPVVEISEEEYRKIHLKPFEEAIRKGYADMVMTAHVLYPTIDNKPGTLSRKFMRDILREELGFEGVIITDCLEMKAMKNTYGVAKATVEAFKAGVDMLLISHSPDLQLESINALMDAVDDGHIQEARVKESLGRVERFIDKLPEFPESIYKVLKLTEKKDFEREVAEKSMVLVEREKVLPLRKDGSVLLLGVNVDNKTMEYLKTKLTGYVNITDILNLREDQILEDGRLSEPDFVLVLTYLRNLNGRNLENPLRSICKQNKNVVHVSLFNPYDILDFDFLPTSIATFGSLNHQLDALVKVLRGELMPEARFPLLEK